MSGSSNVPQSATNIGVINPFALAELVTRRAIDWDTVDERRVFEEAFDRPYEELFDPQYGSPLYPGVELTAEGSIERRSIRDLDLDIEDSEPRSDPDLSNVTNLDDLAERMAVTDTTELEVSNARVNSECLPGVGSASTPTAAPGRRTSRFLHNANRLAAVATIAPSPPLLAPA